MTQSLTLSYNNGRSGLKLEIADTHRFRLMIQHKGLDQLRLHEVFGTTQEKLPGVLAGMTAQKMLETVNGVIGKGAVESVRNCRKIEHILLPSDFDVTDQDIERLWQNVTDRPGTSKPAAKPAANPAAPQAGQPSPSSP